MVITDIDEVYQIECEAFSMPWSIDSLKEELNNAFAFYSVVTIDNKVAAYGGMRDLLGEGEVTNIAVDKDYRGKGLGRQLLENLLKQAKERCIHSITLEVRSSNEAARMLYQSVGFIQIATRSGYYQRPVEDASIMQLKVGNE
jgi:ribosomal-protein-alanine N-acetyltransferase